MFLKTVKWIGAFFIFINLDAQLNIEAVWALAEQMGLCRDFAFCQPVRPTPGNIEPFVGVCLFNSVICDNDEQDDFFDVLKCDKNKRYYLITMDRNKSFDAYKTESDHLVYDNVFTLDISFITQLDISLNKCFFYFAQDYLMTCAEAITEEVNFLPFQKFDVLQSINIQKKTNAQAVVVYNNTPQTIHVVPSKMLRFFDNAVPITVAPYKEGVFWFHFIMRVTHKCGENGEIHECEIGDFREFDNHVLIYLPRQAQNDEENVFRVPLCLRQVIINSIADGFVVDSF